MNNRLNSRRNGISSNTLKERFTGYGFVLPVVLMLAVLLLYPFCYGIYISFFKTDLLNKWKFVGLDNYLKIFEDFTFWDSMKVTLIFTVSVVVGHFILGFCFALMLNRDMKGRTLFRTILLLPWLFPDVVIANLFKWILNPTLGLLNSVLVNIGILDKPMSWIGSPRWALPVVIFVCIWKGYPMIMIQMLAGLQTVSKEVQEAATMDGANAWQSFWNVTIPGMKSTFAVTLILDVIWWFKHMSIVWLMTGGGPNRGTSIIGVDIYKRAFESFSFGPSSAAAVIVFIICIVFTIIQRRMLKDD